MYRTTIAKKHDTQHSHDHEHRQWSRRSFLQALGIGSTGSLLLAGNQLSASSISPLSMALNDSENENILVLIRLAGGNDGLNTIVPVYDFDFYANARPSIYHRENNLVRLNDDFSMPDYMRPLESMWGDGMMKVVHGVGYEGQNLSHFTSSDIWATAQTEDATLNRGWIGRYLNDTYKDFLFSPPEKPLAIQIGSVGNLIFSNEDQQFAFLVSNPKQLENIAKEGVQFGLDGLDLSCKAGQQQEFLRATSNSTYIYSGVINDAYNAAENSVGYQDNNIADQLSIIARLIKGNLGTKVYMVTLNGFDTHANQPEAHARLMGDLSHAVSAFYKDLETTGQQDKVLGMTFSEFGRRVYQNGSDGTDHGAASPTLFFGSGLQGNGFVGAHPDLDDLDKNKNLKSGTDFRDLYATVLSQWFCIDQAKVDLALNGSYSNIDLGFVCTAPEMPENLEPENPETPENPENPDTPEMPGTPVTPGEDTDGKPEENPVVPEIPETFSHRPVYDVSQKPSIKLKVQRAMHVDIRLYSILGQELATLKNGFMLEGDHSIDVEDVIAYDNLSTGEYIYRVTTHEGSSSKIILIR